MQSFVPELEIILT